MRVHKKATFLAPAAGLAENGRIYCKTFRIKFDLLRFVVPAGGLQLVAGLVGQHAVRPQAGAKRARHKQRHRKPRWQGQAGGEVSVLGRLPRARARVAVLELLRVPPLGLVEDDVLGIRQSHVRALLSPCTLR
eukprot:gnl/Hemi2/765_TR283_c0_g5_i1.p2 gnl/Hemi2/765_TR283_c0_g5~~gnl/Hemi2/765_TR283_c0_g5_i1.p2  ORF type:complete len:133 (+),score=3.33 gnl/Hemi2/765_TR283_c0_g5_i1:166-564(+)